MLRARESGRHFEKVAEDVLSPLPVGEIFCTSCPADPEGCGHASFDWPTCFSSKGILVRMLLLDR